MVSPRPGEERWDPGDPLRAIEERIYLLAAYAKSVRDNLTVTQIKVPRRLVGGE